jgi:hypothetical protein
MQAIAPSRSLLLLISIGVLDLVATAMLHSRGLIVELNPVMRPFIDCSEWLFALVKGATLLVAWFFLASCAKKNRTYVRNACLAGSAAYVAIWVIGFLGGRLS